MAVIIKKQFYITLLNALINAFIDSELRKNFN